jgi:hypothetical protein
LAERDPAVSAADVVITVVLLVTFALAYGASQQWPFEARFFPQLLAFAGVAFALLKLVSCGVRLHRRQERTRQPEPAGGVADGQTEAESVDGSQHGPEYVFGTAGRGAWFAALGWVATFFVLLYVLGVFVTVPLFSLAYLRISGRHGFLAAAVYGAVAGLLVWSVFSKMLQVPMPAGIL